MASTRNALRLAEFVCARLCHELSGLIGTLDGALELLPDAQPSGCEPLGLARSASTDMVRRLRFVRAAWGPEGEALSVSAIELLTGGLGGARRLAIDFGGLPKEVVFPPAEARMMLNLLLLASDSLPGGGEMAVMGVPSDLFVRITGPGAGWPAGLAACLADASARQAASPAGHPAPGPV
ncbi:MAG TPA: histidine phosphotransferase family protein, partial [Acetobacteraceae bacterium]